MNANLTTATNAQEINTTAKEEINMIMKVAVTKKPITDDCGHFNLDYMTEIRDLNSAIHSAEIKLTKLNEEAAELLKNILKDYEDFLGGKSHWFATDKEKYFNKIKKYNGLIDDRKTQERIIKEAKEKLSEYDY